MTILQLLLSLTVTVIFYGLYRLFIIVYDEISSPLRDLPGPEYTDLINGNMKEIWADENSLRPHEEMMIEKWITKYGPTIAYSGYFGMKELYTMDTTALNHILTNLDDYQKPEETRYKLTEILGSGLLVVEEAKHKQQRRIMNPAFGTAQVRGLTETFMKTSIQLRDAWTTEIEEQGGIGQLDALSWLGKMTLDVIGLAGFNYRFNALDRNSQTDKLGAAFATVFKGTGRSMMPLLKAYFPPLRLIPGGRTASLQHAHKTMSEIGNRLLRESKASILEGNMEGTIIEKGSLQGRDLLSLLVRANMATNLSDSQRMSDQDVLAQVPTFLVAGHETTSTGTTWALFALAQNPRVQTALRDELLKVTSESPTMDELNALPYLDLFIRESLRLYPPVPAGHRVAMKDDIIPLSAPFTDRKGNIQHTIRIKKGQAMTIPILTMNRSKSIWGEDALEFRPERWQSVPEAAGSVPGVWGNLLTFLGGPRSCIAFRFSLVEMKALIFTLVRAFEFELAVSAGNIGRTTLIVQRPVVMTDPARKSQMPLLIKPYNGS